MVRVRFRSPATRLTLACGLAAVAALVVPAGRDGARAEDAVAADAQARPDRTETFDGRTLRRWSRGRRGRQREPEPETKPEGESKLPPGMQQATPVVTYGDWNVFTSGQGRARVCYAIAQPQSRTPKTLARDTAYLFVTVRKGDNVQNEIAVMFGFKPKPAAVQAKPGATPARTDPYLALGSTRYGLVVKDENAWVQNQAEETRIVAEMARNAGATVRTTSQRGNATTDEYALGGFPDALKRAREECK